jgi:hypothetical protein
LLRLALKVSKNATAAAATAADERDIPRVARLEYEIR